MGLQCCKPHWRALSDKIEERGLSHLVARDGKEAVDRLMEGAQAPAADVKLSAETFDPLMGSWFRVMAVFMEGDGLRAMMSAEMVCPFCDLDKQRDGLAQNWLEGVSTEALQQARLLGLAPKEQ